MPTKVRVPRCDGVRRACPILSIPRHDAMLLEKLFENLALRGGAFATCQVAPGWRLRLPGLHGRPRAGKRSGKGRV